LSETFLRRNRRRRASPATPKGSEFYDTILNIDGDLGGHHETEPARTEVEPVPNEYGSRRKKLYRSKTTGGLAWISPENVQE
jgi:hypothetical protein